MVDWDDWKAPIWGLVGLTAGYIIGGTTLPLIYDAAVSDEIEFPSRSYDIVDIEVPDDALIRFDERGPLCGYDRSSKAYLIVDGFDADGEINFGEPCDFNL